MMTWLKVYLKLAWACKTPLVLLADKRYKPVTEQQLALIIPAAKRAWKKTAYQVDLHDCDDSTDIFKAEASKKAENGVGRVYGLWSGRGLHYWSVVIKENGKVEMIEPQTGDRNRKWGKYIPFAVMI
ncbi:MAG: hypothetical protein JSV77_04920 [Dehalococcoidales bacterium]|nr:MAG: hypothetical protein JSV77_04920 [Dehalococcoidales bacterium]